MKIKNQTTSTRQLREQLNADIDAFLNTGGKITQVQSGVSGQSKMTYSNQSKKKAPEPTANPAVSDK